MARFAQTARRLDSPVTDLKGVGAETASKLAQLGMKTVADVIYNFPRRYDDYSQVDAIRALKPGPVCIRATIKQATGRYVRRGMHITEAVASDETGSVRLVWFNQPYRAAAIKPGAHYFISGEFALRSGRLAITSPAMELTSDFPVNTARIVPIYRETKGIKSRQLRSYIRQAIDSIRALPESLPAWVLNDNKLVPLAQAIEAIHFPRDAADLATARRRLGFEEVFELSLAGLRNKQENGRVEALAVPFNAELAQVFVGHLPFRLTDGQRRVIWQIYQDIAQTAPMNRLIEGDVGSGKTVVATMAALMAIEQGYQVALMAPTELLARQHAATVHRLLEPLGHHHQVGLLVGSLKKAQKTAAHKAIASGAMRFIVGTHALLQEAVDMHRLGMVIIDEQHRFGVEQRKTLLSKAGHGVHILNMTATPIPRTLALTLYGELDISLLTDKPQNRLPLVTKLCSPNSRDTLYAAIEHELAAGRQMFVVTPLISDSETVGARSAEHVYKEMKAAFPGRRVGLLHGKMKSDDKNAVMERFVGGDIDIMVATTVIEVGVDVPNATIMLIENADRFGLAQIHQLRGRVGRGEHQGTCYLMMSDSKAPSKRLRALETSSDGFRLAELDLELRGPGAIYGTMQHGALDLRIAQLTDTQLVISARRAAEKFIARDENLLHYPRLASRVLALQAVTHLN